MKWFDSAGKEQRQSTKCRKKSDAKDVAAAKQAELNRAVELTEFGVDAFRERYLLEFLASKSQAHKNKFTSNFDLLVEITGRELVSEITTADVADFAKYRRDDGRAESTISGDLGYIKRALDWAVSRKLLAESPMIDKPSVPDEGAAKGRPLLMEEIERMISKIPDVVGDKHKTEFEFLFIGLQLSGLRLGEAMRLWWRDGDSKKIIVQVGANVTLEIPASGQKRRKREIYPVVPDFARHLLSVPIHERTGPVFNPIGIRGKAIRRTDTVSKRISELGQLAGVVVKRDDDTNKSVFASAHDLRRTFGLKWAKRVKSIELKQLMRHRSIKTTETYYAFEDANDLAASLEKRFGGMEEKPIAKDHQAEIRD